MSSRAGWEEDILALLLVGGGVIVLGLSLILFLTPPATGYEFSVYRGFPLSFWILVVAGLFVGQLIIVRAALFGEAPARPWRIGLVVIVAIEAFLFSLPYHRGYQAYDRADVLTHVGFVRNIDQLGTLIASDIYPNIHLLTLALSYATGVEPLHIINAVSVVIPTFSILAWYALVTQLYDRRRALLALPFVTLLVGAGAYVNPSPFTQSTLLVPFVLLLFVRERQARTVPSRIALGLAVVGIVIYHPLTTVFLLLGLVAYVAADTLRSRGLLEPSTTQWRSSVGNGMSLQLMAALLVSWYYSFDPILNRGTEAFQSLVGTGGGQSDIDQYTSVVSETSPRLADLVTIGLAKYGVSGVLLGVGGLYVVLTLAELVSDRTEVDVTELAFSFAFVGFAGLSVLFLLFDLVVGWGRPLLYVNVFGALLAGPLFYKLYRTVGSRRIEYRRAVTGFLCLLLLAHTVLGVATLYHSPTQAQPSHQVTAAELDASQWLLDNRNRYTSTVEYGISFYRFADVYYGKNKSSPREVVDPDNSIPPPHFGYDQRRTLGASYESDQYLIITPKGRDFYPEMYPEYRDQWRYTPEDFRRLQQDPTVARLYDNGGVRVYRTNGTAG